MFNTLDSVLVFAFLTFFHLWGGAAIGAGLRARRILPIVWGVLLGGVPLYFGVERLVRLGSWAGLLWQAAWLLISICALAFAMPRLRAWFLKDGVTALMIGSLIMIGGALVGSVFFDRGSEALSLIFGGAGFLFGAMWFGSGLQQLREK
jgi:hypothetical protein